MEDLRLTDIEMKIAYQERMLSELDAVVCEQQKTIDDLQKTSRLLMERVIELSEALSTSTIIDEKPPHY